MKTQLIEVRTGGHEGVFNLTAACEEFAREATGGGDGLLHVFVPHATAGLAVIETGAGSDTDLMAVLADVLPADDRWRHAHGSRGHGRSHVLPAFLAPYTVLPVLAARWPWASGSPSSWSTSTSTTPTATSASPCWPSRRRRSGPGRAAGAAPRCTARGRPGRRR